MYNDLCVPLRLYEKKIISVTELVEVTNKMPSTGSGTVHSSLKKKHTQSLLTVVRCLLTIKKKSRKE